MISHTHTLLQFSNTRQASLNMGKGSEETFLKNKQKTPQMAIKHVKRYSMSLVIKKCKSKPQGNANQTHKTKSHSLG